MMETKEVEMEITEAESKVFNTLVDAYKQYRALPPLSEQFHKGELDEFCRAIQTAQRVIIARAVLKVINDEEE